MTTIEIPSDLILHSGSHEPESGQHCILNCAAYYAPACGFEEKRKDLPWDDHQSICRAVRSFAIAVNDSSWSSDEARTVALKPVICLVLGTEKGPKITEKRLYCLANHAFHWASKAFKHAEIQKQCDDLAHWVGKITGKESAARAAAAAWAARAAGAAGAAEDPDKYLKEAAEVLLEICLI